MSASFCHDLGLSFNPLKSKVLVFSKKKVDLLTLMPISLNGNDVEYVTSISYLGVSIVSDRGFCVSAANELRTFYRAANSILTAIQKPSEEIVMQLLYTNCVPIITYACGIKCFSSRDMRDCNTAINNCIRKIFSFHRWESTRLLRETLGYKSIYEIFAKTSEKLLAGLAVHPNYILRLIHLNSH